MEYSDVVRDFAERTRVNLRAIEGLRSGGFEVYETTQLINSMLGLLVFPREEFVEHVPTTPLTQLRGEGWPTPRTSQGFPEAENLRDLIRYLRNAIAHFNVEFLSDENREIVGVRVWNTPPKSTTKNWQAEMRLDELRSIAERFTDVILQEPAAEQRRHHESPAHIRMQPTRRRDPRARG